MEQPTKCTFVFLDQASRHGWVGSSNGPNYLHLFSSSSQLSAIAMANCRSWRCVSLRTSSPRAASTPPRSAPTASPLFSTETPAGERRPSQCRTCSRCRSPEVDAAVKLSDRRALRRPLKRPTGPLVGGPTGLVLPARLGFVWKWCVTGLCDWW